MESLKIYFKLIRISMQGRMQYRIDFFVGIISILILNIASLSLIGIILGRFQTMNGWNIWEIVFLYCFWVSSHSIYSLLFWHFTSIEEYIIQGTFDQFLLRPVSVLVQFLGREVQYMGFADVFIGITGLILAYQHLHLHWNFLYYGFLVISILAGTVIEVSIYWIISSITFWKLRFQAGMYITMNLHSVTQKYPLDIFGKWFGVLVTGIIPLAFTNYYPALVLLRKVHQNPFPNVPFLPYMAPVVALLFLGISGMVWKVALKNYSSTGN